MCATRTKSDLPQYFYIPSNSSTNNYKVRLTPPKALQHLVKGQYRATTGTSDLRKARAIGARLIAEKLAEWDALLTTCAPPQSAPIFLTNKSMKDICAQRLYHWMRMDDLGRYQGDGYDDATLSGLQGLWDSTGQTMRSVVARGKASPEWESALEVLDSWCEQIDLTVSRADPLYAVLAKEFAKVELKALGWVRARNQGEAVDSPKPPAATGSELSTMTAVYREHLTESKNGKGLSTPVGIWKKFVGHVGDIPIEDVVPNDVFTFLREGIHAPTHPWSMKYAHGVVRRTLRAVFSLAITTGRRRAANPVDGMSELPRITKEQEKERLNPRRAYSDAEINKVLASDWYNPEANRWKGKMASDLGARFWTPLICLFHGNRVREVMQLVASDFHTLDNLHCMTIQEAIGGEQPELKKASIVRTLKNESTQRTVPLHPQLVALGFLDFLQSRRDADGTTALLFPSCIPKLGGKTPILGRAYEQAYVRFIRETVGAGLGNHGFRHQLEDRIRRAQTPGNQWPAGLGQEYMGRRTTRAKDKEHVAAVGSEGDYGEGYPPMLMQMYVKSLDFSRIKLPPIFSEWLKGGALSISGPPQGGARIG